MVWLIVPKFDRGDGACIHLTETNECRIYSERPEQCRVDTTASDDKLASACSDIFNLVESGEHEQLK